jgi:PAS domain S-box-containing protein
MLDPLLGERAAFATVLIALMPLTLLVRPAPFVAGAALGLVGTLVLFIPPRWSLRIEGPEAGVQFALFTLATATMLLTAALSRRLERTRSGARLEAERTAALLAALVESCDDAVISKDGKGMIQSFNAGAERLLGYSAAEVIGSPISLLIPPERRQEESERLHRVVREGRGLRTETVRICKDGGLLEVSLTLSPIRAGGRVVGVSSITRDISLQRFQERQRAHRMIELQEALDRGPAGSAAPSAGAAPAP